MPTFLQLCQTVREECGVAGTIDSVVGQKGMILRLVNCVKKANRKIQLRKGNWNFMWSNWQLSMVANISEYAPPSLLGNFDEDSFWLNTGMTGAKKLKYEGYTSWRDSLRNSYNVPGDVSLVTLKPNGKVGVLPAPDTTGDIITADYWKSPVELTDNSQISLIPEQFHGVITEQAKMYYAEFDGDSGLYSSAFIEHESLYKELKAHSLPGNQNDARSESSSDQYIFVI